MNKKGEIILPLAIAAILIVGLFTVFLIKPKITGLAVYTGDCGGSISTSGYWELDVDVDCTSSGNGANGAVIINVSDVELDCKEFQIKDTGSLSDFIGISVNAIKNNTIIRNCNILADSDSGSGYGIKIKGNNTLVKDTNINATDAQFHILVEGSNLYTILLNTTYTGTAPDESCTGSVVERKWYLNVQVNWSNGTAVSGAFVQAFNTSGIADYSGNTDSNGRVRFNATHYINNGSTKTYYNLYKVNATGSYAENSSVDVSGNTFVQLTLAAAPSNTAPYNITLISPANNSAINDTTTINFTFIAYDHEQTILSCDLYLDSVLNKTDNVNNGTITGFLINNISYASHNWSVSCSDGELSNSSATFYFLINDTLGPAITTTPDYGGFYVSPQEQELDAEINFSADISDVSNVNTVLLNITGVGTYTMNKNNDTYQLGFNTSTFGYGTFNFTIWANDSRGNSNQTALQNFTIIDLRVPSIWNVSISPVFLSAPGNTVTISANVIDDLAVSVVLAQITFPNDSKQNFSMSNVSSLYSKTLSDVNTNQRGRYTVVIWANDSSGNSIDTSNSQRHFYVPPVVLITNGETFTFGDSLNIIGFGFSTDANVMLKINNTALLTQFNVTTDSVGNFSTSYTVPSNANLGDYTLFAIDPILPAVFDEFKIIGVTVLYGKGTALVPMDLKQGKGNAYDLNYLKAYGLVYKLLALGIDIDWVITPPCFRLQAKDIDTNEDFDERYCHGFFLINGSWSTIQDQNTAGVVLHNLTSAARITKSQIVELRRKPKVAVLSGSEGQIVSTLIRSEINYTLLSESQIISNLNTASYDILLVGNYDFNGKATLADAIKNFVQSGGYVHAEDDGAISLNSYTTFVTSLAENGRKKGDLRILVPSSPLTQTHLETFSNSGGRMAVLDVSGSYAALVADDNYDISSSYVKFIGISHEKGYVTYSGGHIGSSEGSAELSRPRNRLLDNCIFYALEINDQSGPVIKDVLPVANSDFSINNTVNISAVVIDNVAVDSVWAIIEWNATQQTKTLSGPDASALYSCSFTNTSLVDRYNITIHANDSDGNNANATTWFNVVAAGEEGGGGGGVCTDDCSPFGKEEKSCVNSTTLKTRSCGDYDSDSCLEWGNWSYTSCGANKTCINGACVSTVENCTENWNCSEWSDCLEGIQTRVCEDVNACGTTYFKPNETRTCEEEEKKEEVEEEKPAPQPYGGGLPKKIPKPSNIIPHGDVPPIVVDTASYTVAAAAVATGLHLFWFWLLSLLIPFFLLRLRHFCVAIIDFRTQLPFVVAAKGKTATPNITVKKDEIGRLIKLLSNNMREKIIYAKKVENYDRFVFEKGGFIELQLDMPFVLNAHFSSRKKARRFKAALQASLNKILKGKSEKEKKAIMKQIYTNSETSSIIAALRSLSRLRKSRKAIKSASKK